MYFFSELYLALNKAFWWKPFQKLMLENKSLWNSILSEKRRDSYEPNEGELITTAETL